MVDRLSGGYQQGALLLTDETGARAVLKRTIRRVPAARLDELASIVEVARGAGWPTPRWHGWGELDGWGWWLTEFVPGSVPDAVSVGFADAIEPIVERQRDLAPATSQDWSAYIKRVGFLDESAFASTVSTFSAAGAELVATIDRLVRPHAAIDLPADDLVHGNLDPGNVIFQGRDVVAIVDIESLGKGTRAVDLAGLAVSAAIWGDPIAAERLATSCDRVAGPAVADICIAAAVLAVLAFGVENWRGDVDSVCAACTEFLRSRGQR